MDQSPIAVENDNVSNVSRDDREIQETRSERDRREEREAEERRKKDVSEYDEARYRSALKEVSKLRSLVAALVMESPDKAVWASLRAYHAHCRMSVEFVEDPAQMRIGAVVSSQGKVVTP
jgi:hypothetical protein